MTQIQVTGVLKLQYQHIKKLNELYVLKFLLTNLHFINNHTILEVTINPNGNTIEKGA